MNFGRFSVDLANMVLCTAVAASLLLSGSAPGDAAVAMSYTVAFGMFVIICNMVFSSLFPWGSNVERMLEILSGDIPAERITCAWIGRGARARRSRPVGAWGPYSAQRAGQLVASLKSSPGLSA